MDTKDIAAEIKKGDAERVNRATKATKVLEDARVESDASHVSLAEFRWNWTRNADNPDKISQREYAKLVGVSDQQVSQYARGYELWQENTDRPIGEALLRARMSDDRWEATLRVAQKRRVTPATAVATYGKEIKDVFDIMKLKAAEQAESDKKTESTPATVSKISDAKSVKDAKAVKADANKVAKSAASSATKGKLTAVPANNGPRAGEVVEATWEPPTDRELDEYLADYADKIKKAYSSLMDVKALKAPADMILSRHEIFERMLTSTTMITQEIKNLMIGAEIDHDSAKVKKAN